MSSNTLTPMLLKDEPALIERVFPAQKISAEAQKERKAVSGQTLTGLGSYWKGRKPLIMVRSIVLGSLLPVTEDLEADLAIFEKLMAIDDASFVRRNLSFSLEEIARNISLGNPWSIFKFKYSGDVFTDAEIEQFSFPLEISNYPGLSISWQRNVDPETKASIMAKAASDMDYEEKLSKSKRPEEIDPETLYGPIWHEVNNHLSHFGVEAHSHEELVNQLGILRYGHRPRVGDTFCGGGSIPFEAARLGCDAYASDLNPIACMLAWGAFNIIGANKTKREEIERKQQNVAEAVDLEISKLGIEHDEQGNRAKAFLYCLETRCPETGWMVPMAPSWVISKKRNVVAKLVPDYGNKRFKIDVVSDASASEMKEAAQGTVRNGKLDFFLDGKRYTTPISTIRGDYKDENGVRQNRLRQWEVADFKPRENDIFQERLYAIQWIEADTVNSSRQKTFFASVTDGDIEREHKVEQIVQENLLNWQEQGLVPDMPIEPGYNTNQPIRERGWRYWHQLFNSRHLLINYLFFSFSTDDPEKLLLTPNVLDNNNKLCQWLPTQGGGTGGPKHLFANQALNTLFNFPVRGSSAFYTLLFDARKSRKTELISDTKIRNVDSSKIEEKADVWITDPPYADAINYHEITEFFIAWLRKNAPAPFDQWNWDSRRALAIQGSGKDFRRSMVESYSAMAENMPDNGLQCVMFTHQDTGVWGDMISIFWAADLQVVGAWYIATETSTALRSGAHVQGTVTLILRKRGQGSGEAFKRQLFPKIRKEVDAQVAEMMRLNDSAKTHGKSVFSDADLQMAGYAAALKVLTGYTKVDGKDVTTFAMQPRGRGEKNVVDEIVEYAAEIANNALIPEQLKAINEDTWDNLTGVERFYVRLLAIESSGQFKLDNYQNFGKAFKVDYQPLMATMQADKSRLKGAKDFRGNELTNGDLAQTALGEVMIALRELLDGKEPQGVLAQMQSNLGAAYIAMRPHLKAMSQYIAAMAASQRPDEADKAEILANRIQNEGW